jgi:Na+/phosphate symporter
VFLPVRLTVLLTALTLVLFQTHWVDDLGTDEPDVLGIGVSAIGSALLVTGLLLRRRGCGRALLVLGFLFVAFVSAADLCGLDTNGAFAPDVVAHWRDHLGWGLTLAVALTAFLSLAGVVVLITGYAREFMSPSS